jgi:hypothetical protein
MPLLQLQHPQAPSPQEWVAQAAEFEQHPAEALEAADRLIAWCHAVQVRCTAALRDAGELHRLTPGPHRNDRDHAALLQRAETAERAVRFADALAQGRLSAAHLDEVARSLRRLEPTQQRALLADEARLVALAAEHTAPEFARLLRREERRLGRAADSGSSDIT